MPEPTTPSASRPFLSWKAFKAATDLAPNLPSAVPVRYFSSIRRCCTILASLPLEPLRTVVLGFAISGRGVGVAVGVGDGVAPEVRPLPKSSAWVSLPQMPSWVRPFFFWKAFTAVMVALS